MGLGCHEESNCYGDKDYQSAGEDEPCDLALKIIYCSICLEIVARNGDRGIAYLICGHRFHLDCIGSAFNVKGGMECPNCRRIENGRWLYSNGSRPYHRVSANRDEDLYELRSYAETSFGVHWCPYPNSTRPHPPYEESEFPFSSFPEVASSTSNRCPYVAYYGPVYHHSSSPSSSSFTSQWNRPRASSQNPNFQAFNAIDLRYRNMEPPSHRHVRSPSEVARPSRFPFVSPSASGTILSSISPYQESNARTRDRVEALQAYYQQQPDYRGEVGYHGVPLPGESSSDPNGLFYGAHRSFPDADHESLRYRYGENLWSGDTDTAIRSDTGTVTSSAQTRRGTERLFRS